MNYDTLLRIHNNDEEITYIFAANSESFRVRPLSETLVPFDAVVNSMGDPRSGPTPQRIQPEGGGVAVQIPSRLEEIKRLNTVYGIYTESVDAPSHVEGSEGITLLDRIPKVTATNVDETDPISFPCDDPNCERYTPEDQDKSTMAVMQRQLEAMRRKQVVYEQLIRNAQGNAATTALGTEEVGDDTPQAQARRKTG